MAWRKVAQKGIRANLIKALTASASRQSILTATTRVTTRSASGFVRCFEESSINSALWSAKDCKCLGNPPFMRFFHSSPELFARRGNDVLDGSKATRKGKYKRKATSTKPPVDEPFVPRRLKKTSKPLPDKTIEIFEGMTIMELAKRSGESIRVLQNILTNVGENIGSDFDSLSIDIAELVAMEVGVNVRRLHSSEGTKLLPRPPVVTVMGHVDHGKTSLLDALRSTSVAAKEAGGITQHIGAFVVKMPSGASITFLDTPGHAAFSAMRARGAAVTDLVVLVVAADDGVMPQTIEAMAHARDADVPIVVAINKCDKPAADPGRVKIQLASEGLPLEEMGGDIQVVEVSALSKTGLGTLEEALLLQAEMMDLKARIDGPAQAYVVEARLDRGRGPLATAIVKAGTLVCGQHIVVGAEWGRIRAIRDTTGELTEQATPAMPVEIEGLKGLPMAGDDITAVESEERAKMLSAGRKTKLEKDRLLKINEDRTVAPDPSDDLPVRVDMPVIVIADVQGSVQAVTDALKSLNSSQVFINVIHVGVGTIGQSDLDLAQACGACIVGFNVRAPSGSVGMSTTKDGVKIIAHRVIYHLLEDIGSLIVEKAPGTFETKVGGQGQVLDIFEVKGRSKAQGVGFKIAGCRVLDGRFTRSSTMRLLRSGEILFEGSCASLKREKQDVDTIGKGNDCGLVLQDWSDFQVGDIIQCLEQVNRRPKFISSESGAVRIEC